MLRRSPGFSALAILCLTVGIGATAAVSSWIEGVLLRPFPLVVDQDQLVALTGTNRGAAGGGREDVSWPDFKDLERSSNLAEAFIGDKITGTTLSIRDRAERVPGSMVSANYFDAIGVHPILGQGFQPGDDVGRNAHAVTVISYQMWQERFHGDPSVIGQTQLLAGMPHTIVGVAPQGFYGTFVGYAFQFWVPASMQTQFDAGVYKLDDRGARWIEGFVRLKPGRTIDQAQAELSAIASRLESDYPETNRGHGIQLYPLWQTPFNNAGAMLPTLAIALGVVVAVLLIACANVGNLLLVRALARQQEMTIRVSVGAGRMRLVRQLITEGIVLSVIATAGGLVVARWLRDGLAFLTPPRGGVLLRLPGAIDWRVLALSAGLSAFSTLLFALVPAILTSHVDLASALRSESGGVVGARGRSWVRSTLVLVQMSLSFVLLVGAGLLIQSLQAVRHADPGFSTSGVLTTSLDLFTAGYDAQRAKNLQLELVDRLQARGGIESAAFSRRTPFSYQSYSSAPIAVDGYDAPPNQQPTAEYNEIGPGYLATIGIPIVAGREFTRADDENAPAVADRRSGDGRAVLARRGSGRTPRAGQGSMAADRRRGANREISQPGRDAASVFLRPTPAEFLRRGDAADPNRSGPGRDRADPRPGNPRAGSERLAGRSDHDARAGRSHDRITAHRRHDSWRLRDGGPGARRYRAVRRDGGDGVAKHARARVADGTRGRDR